MNFFICKCDKNQCQEEKTAMDLLDIKNLEKTLKDKEKEILRNDNINMIETRNDTDLKENLSNDDELEIIEYPYSKKIIIKFILIQNKIKLKIILIIKQKIHLKLILLKDVKIY